MVHTGTKFASNVVSRAQKILRRIERAGIFDGFGCSRPCVASIRRTCQTPTVCRHTLTARACIAAARASSTVHPQEVESPPAFVNSTSMFSPQVWNVYRRQRCSMLNAKRCTGGGCNSAFATAIHSSVRTLLWLLHISVNTL